MIDVRGLTKSFGQRTALAGIDLSVSEGEFVTLMGPNGAGKTTLLRILATICRPTSGRVRIAGLDVTRMGEDARRRIGFLSHRTLLYEDLSAEQNLRFYSKMYDLPDAAERTSALLKRVGLSARQRDLVGTFSRGMQQRLSVARAVIHRPQVLLMDEPFTGLDPNAAQILTDLLADLAEEGCTIALTTHNLERGLAIGQRIVILDRGRVVHDSPRGELDRTTLAEVYRSLPA